MIPKRTLVMRGSVEDAGGISSLACCLVLARAHPARTLTPALSHPMGEGEHRDCGSVHITRLWINLTRRYARPASLRVGVAPRSTLPPPHATMRTWTNDSDVCNSFEPSAGWG